MLQRVTEALSPRGSGWPCGTGCSVLSSRNRGGGQDNLPVLSEESEGWRWCPGDLRSEEESPREDRLLNLRRRRRGQGLGTAGRSRCHHWEKGKSHPPATAPSRAWEHKSTELKVTAARREKAPLPSLPRRAPKKPPGAGTPSLPARRSGEGGWRGERRLMQRRREELAGGALPGCDGADGRRDMKRQGMG